MFAYKIKLAVGAVSPFVNIICRVASCTKHDPVRILFVLEYAYLNIRFFKGNYAYLFANIHIFSFI